MGGVDGDRGREALGEINPQGSGFTICHTQMLASGAFEVRGPNQYSTAYGTSQADRPKTLRLRMSRVQPTGPAFVPRRWGALACVYLGTPAS